MLTKLSWFRSAVPVLFHWDSSIDKSLMLTRPSLFRSPVLLVGGGGAGGGPPEDEVLEEPELEVEPPELDVEELEVDVLEVLEEVELDEVELVEELVLLEPDELEDELDDKSSQLSVLLFHCSQVTFV